MNPVSHKERSICQEAAQGALIGAAIGVSFITYFTVMGVGFAIVEKTNRALGNAPKCSNSRWQTR